MSTVGVDIGGTTTEVVRVEEDGEIAARLLVPTQPGDDLPQSAIDAVRAVADPAELTGVGVGVPGQVDAEVGRVSLAVNLGIGPEGLPLGSEMESALGVPVALENDVRAASLGAYRHLPDSQVGVLVLLALGTGVSAGVVIEGHILRGRDGMAGEVGHVIVDPEGPRCACGLNGCLEAFVAGPAIAAQWPHGDTAPAAHLFARAEEGDPAAQALVDRLTDHLARSVHMLVMTYGADKVVLGGGVGRIGAPLLAAIYRQFDNMTSCSPLAKRELKAGRVTTAPADLPLGALGAAEVALDRLGGGRAAVLT